MSFRIYEGADVTDADRQAVKDGLRAYNLQFMTYDEPRSVDLILRDDAGQVLGGLIGSTRWHWLWVDKLWVAEPHRGQGHGSALLARAEAIGHERGCRFCALDTAGFPAIPFYLKQGYAPYGELPDNPPGSRTVYLYKELTDAT